MANTPVIDQASWVKQSGRARVYVFFWAFVLVAIGNTVGEERDILLHVLDDYLDIIFAVIALAVIAILWRKKIVSSLKTANNVAMILSVLFILATVFAITQEASDPADFANEIPSLFLGVALVINRFV